MKKLQYQKRKRQSIHDNDAKGRAGCWEESSS